MEFTRLYNGNGHPPGKGAYRAPLTAQAVPTFGWVQQNFNQAKLAYAANLPSKFRRIRHGLGGTADAHYRSGLKFWEMREYARDMDRNDVVVGQLVDRLLDNILGVGLWPDPQVDDEVLADEMVAMWEEWALNPLLCDYSRKKDFYQLERLALRQRTVDGDCLVLPYEEDQTLYLQLLEGDRLLESTTVSGDIVHGVELDFRTDRIQAYHFAKPRKGVRQWGGRRVPVAYDTVDTIRIPYLDDRGRLQVYHLYDPQRVTQTRGVTAFRAVFDILGMFEDLNFAKLVQQQVVSCIAVFVQRERDFMWGNRSTETGQRDDGEENTFERLTPGMTVRLKPGETVQGFSPSVPNPEFFQHVRLILRLVGCAIGMPLELVLMDTSDTTFHGYRGALQQAQKGFYRTQRVFPGQFHRHVWNRLVDMWLPKLGRAAAANPKLRRCDWRGEGWPYVEPLNDAKADQLRLTAGLASPRKVHSERGVDWDDVKREIVEDWGSAIELAQERALAINKKFKDKENPENQPFVTWRDILHLESKSTGSVGVDAALGFESGQPRDAQGHLLGSTKKKPDEGAEKKEG